MITRANTHHPSNDAEADLYLLSSLCNRLASKSYHSFFNNSKYARWYEAIIIRAKRRWQARPMNVCAEKHHVIPKSFGGPNEEWNYAFLTPREHFVCHLLLQKAVSTSYQQSQMRLALRYMIRRPGYEAVLGQIPSKSRLYLELREAHRSHRILYWADPANRQAQRERLKAVDAAKTDAYRAEEQTWLTKASQDYWSTVSPEEKRRIYDSRKKTAHNRGLSTYYDPRTLATALHRSGEEPSGWLRGDPSLRGRKGQHIGKSIAEIQELTKRFTHAERRKRNEAMKSEHEAGAPVEELSSKYGLHVSTVKRLLASLSPTLRSAGKVACF